MTGDRPLFLFGRLRHTPLLALVAGEAGLAAKPAFAPDRVAVHAQAGKACAWALPLLAVRRGARAEGVLIHPGAAARARIDAYARAFGQTSARLTVDCPTGKVEALHYAPVDRRAGGSWSLGPWVDTHGALALAVAEALMAELPSLTPDATAHRLTMVQRRAASRLRARAEPIPACQRRRAAPGDVAVSRLSRPHIGFFALEVVDLRFRRFDGTMSPVLRREGFVMADAVTVLPYDPHADLVLLVEQFRLGPWLRGEPDPWMLEPVAGYVDAGEAPEACARREAFEEAGLALGALHRVGGYYPSPGSVSEYTYSYIGLAALAGHDGRLGGLDAEAEDIRAHVVPFERLMALLESGELATGPLMLSAYWLAANRARLRAREGR